MIKEDAIEEKQVNNQVLRISRPALNVRIFLMVLVLLTFPYTVGLLRDLSLRALSLISTIMVLIILILLIRLTVRGLWSASATYLLIFSIFHFGALFVYGLGLQFTGYFNQYYKIWFYNIFTKEAIILSLIGFFACFLGVHIVFVLSNKPIEKPSFESDLETLLSTTFSIVGFAVLTVGIGVWFIVSIRVENTFILLASYEEYRAATANQGVLAYTNYAISLGLPLLVSIKTSRWHIWGYLLFGIWALIAFPLGLRGEVLFPLGAAVVVAVRNGYKISLSRALIIFLLLLSVISMVRQIRQFGLRDFAGQEIDLSPTDALLEMGGTLRSVTETYKWRAAGDDFIYGASYYAPFERLFARFIPGVERINANLDFRLMNVLVMRRVGPIGFSPIGEAYRNFGTVGVFTVMFLLGLLFSKLDLWPTTTLRNSIIVVIYVPLLIQIRNSFTSVPIQWLIGGGLVLATFIITKMVYSINKDLHSANLQTVPSIETTITEPAGSRNKSSL